MIGLDYGSIWKGCIWFCKQRRRVACFFSAPAPFMTLRKRCLYFTSLVLKRGFQTCSISVTWKIEMLFLGSHSRPTKIRNSRHGDPATCILTPHSHLDSDAQSSLKTPAPKPDYSKWRPWASSIRITLEPVRDEESAKSQICWPRSILKITRWFICLWRVWKALLWRICKVQKRTKNHPAPLPAHTLYCHQVYSLLIFRYNSSLFFSKHLYLYKVLF